MRRREFIRLVVSCAATLSQMDARAQQSLPVIGILGSSTAGDYGPMIIAFRKGLSETGYLEGKNVGFDSHGQMIIMIGCLRWPPS